MAAVNNTYDQSSDTSHEKQGYDATDVRIHDGANAEEDLHHHLHRGLKARQITMIAIGGAIGTGLIIGT